MTIKHMVQKKENETNITPDTEELQSKEGNSTEETSGINSIVLNNNSEKAYALLGKLEFSFFIFQEIPFFSANILFKISNNILHD